MKKSLAIASLFALSLAGCADTYQAQVNRFNLMPAAAGQSFVLHTRDPKLSGGIEFSRYAALVAAQLQAKGYTPATNPETATLIVDMDYALDKSETVREVVIDPFWHSNYGWGRHGAVGAWGAGWGWGYNPRLLGVYGNDYVIYNSTLNVIISNRSTGQHLFEGHAKALSASDSLSNNVPKLVQALFTNFPGNNGETVKITIAAKK